MSKMQEFFGYKRPDGSVGVRNHVIVISTMDNTNPVARRIAAAVTGVIPIVAPFGRGQRGEDLVQHDRTLVGFGLNPNTAATLVISLHPGSAREIAQQIANTGKPVEWFSIQEVGGTIKGTELGIRMTARMVAEAGRIPREPASLSALVLGVECGGSDTTSGLVSNPATGIVADWLVDAGGAVILSETEEIMGAEHSLARRAVSPRVAEQIIAAVETREERARQLGIELTTLDPDNQKGGLSTMEEKSLGAVRKGGTRPVQEVIVYAQRPSKKGLVFMDAPAPGTENTTGLAAAGAQVIIFTTGVGNPIGNPVSPTIKVCANPNTVAHFGDNIDVDISGVIKGERSMKEASETLYQELLDVASGKMTCSEILGDVEIAVTRLESA